MSSNLQVQVHDLAFRNKVLEEQVEQLTRGAQTTRDLRLQAYENKNDRLQQANLNRTNERSREVSALLEAYENKNDRLQQSNRELLDQNNKLSGEVLALKRRLGMVEMSIIMSLKPLYGEVNHGMARYEQGAPPNTSNHVQHDAVSQESVQVGGSTNPFDVAQVSTTNQYDTVDKTTQPGITTASDLSDSLHVVDHNMVDTVSRRAATTDSSTAVELLIEEAKIHYSQRINRLQNEHVIHEKGSVVRSPCLFNDDDEDKYSEILAGWEPARDDDDDDSRPCDVLTGIDKKRKPTDALQQPTKSNFRWNGFHPYPCRFCRCNIVRFSKKCNPPMDKDGNVVDTVAWPDPFMRYHREKARSHMRTNHPDIPEIQWPLAFAFPRFSGHN